MSIANGHDFSAQSRVPIQILEEARDAVQTIHIAPTTITTGSIDGHVRVYDLRKGELRSDFLGREFSACSFLLSSLALTLISRTPYTDPVTALVPTQDGQTLLVTTLDSHIRLMDLGTGKMLNCFAGHYNSAYRCRACLGHAEASVVCGDENGLVWAWDLLDVGFFVLRLLVHSR